MESCKEREVVLVEDRKLPKEGALKFGFGAISMQRVRDGLTSSGSMQKSIQGGGNNKKVFTFYCTSLFLF